MIRFFFNKSMPLSYLFSALIVIASCYYHFRDQDTAHAFFFNEKNATAALLVLCLLTVDWTVKKFYWANKSSYHLLVFSLGVFALPIQTVNNWMMIYTFFFWVAFIHLLTVSSQGQEVKGTFNAGFFLCFGSLFFPAGFFLYPVLWLVLLIHGLLNARLFLVSLLPILSVYLIEVMFSAFFPAISFFQEINVNHIDFEWAGLGSFRQNIWWLILLGLFFITMIKHYVSLGAKSASYGAGIFSLFLLGFISVAFALVFHTVSAVAWVLFVMVVASLSTRFFEEIKQTWLREGLFVLVILLFFVSKTGILFMD